MRIKVKHYLDEYRDGGWHTVDYETEEDTYIIDSLCRHQKEKPNGKFRIRKARN